MFYYEHCVQFSTLVSLASAWPTTSHVYLAWWSGVGEVAGGAHPWKHIEQGWEHQ